MQGSVFHQCGDTKNKMGGLISSLEANNGEEVERNVPILHCKAARLVSRNGIRGLQQQRHV